MGWLAPLGLLWFGGVKRWLVVLLVLVLLRGVRVGEGGGGRALPGLQA